MSPRFKQKEGGLEKQWALDETKIGMIGFNKAKNKKNLNEVFYNSKSNPIKGPRFGDQITKYTFKRTLPVK